MPSTKRQLYCQQCQEPIVTWGYGQGGGGARKYCFECQVARKKEYCARLWQEKKAQKKALELESQSS